MKNTLVLFLWIVLGTGCDYNRFDTPQPSPGLFPAANMSIATLRSMYVGRPFTIDGEQVVLSGYITSSDQENNFFRTFMVEDETGAIEVRAGLYNLFNNYRINQQVYLRPHQFTLGIKDGTLQLGLRASTPFNETEYINQAFMVERLVQRGEYFHSLPPTVITPTQARVALTGCLVQLHDLYLDPPCDTTWARSAALNAPAPPQDGLLKFRSHAQDSIYVFTSGYASFAARKVPRTKISITGILCQGMVNSKVVYQLKIRNIDDIQQK